LLSPNFLSKVIQNYSLGWEWISRPLMKSFYQTERRVICALFFIRKFTPPRPSMKNFTPPASLARAISLFFAQFAQHILANSLFCLQFTKITAIANYWNFRELSAMVIFDISDQTKKKQAMWILTFALQLSSALSIVFLWVHWVPFSASWVVRNNNNIPIALVISQRLDKSKVISKVDRKQPS